MEHLINRFKSVSAFRKGRESVDFFPPLIHVELTNYCNLNCVYCPRSEMRRKVGYMDIALAEKIAAEAKGKAEFVTLHAWGESLLHPDFSKINNIFADHGLKTQLSTNATLLNGKLINRLLESRIDFLVLSIDAATEETYNKIRVGGDFTKTINNVNKLLTQVKQSRHGPFTVCQLIYSKLNMKEAEEFRKTWEKKGAHVWLKPFMTWSGEKTEFEEYRPDGSSDKKPRGLCDWPWRQMVIHWDGNVVPCCHDYDGRISLGNVKENSIMEIWNSKKMREFRKAHVQKGRKGISFCSNCSYTSLSPLKQLVFTAVPYSASLKLQTRFENYYKKVL